MKTKYPTLLQTINKIDSNSWFDIHEQKVDNKKVSKNKEKKIKVSYIETYTIVLNLTNIQKEKINKWLDDCIDIYNIANNYIKNNINKDNKNTIINFINLRKILKNDIKNICSINGLNKHTADYAVKHCIEMYKSAFSNHKYMEKFNIKNLEKTRRRKNLTIEPANISAKENSIFIKSLGVIDSSLPLNIISSNSILQLDTYTNKYKIITPYKIKKEIIKNNENKKCGIDIGVRTFLTTYGENEIYKIGTKKETYKKIDKINERLDNIQSSFNKKIISKNKLNKLNIKYRDKLKNSMNDLHNKTANFLLKKYDTIIIGKVSIKKMVSNISSNLHEITKRRLIGLSHYKFRMKLESMCDKFGAKIIYTDEYLTSKCCSKCGNIKNDLGSSEIYNCDKCKLSIDRDINAAINIYKNEKIIKQ